MQKLTFDVCTDTPYVLNVVRILSLSLSPFLSRILFSFVFIPSILFRSFSFSLSLSLNLLLITKASLLAGVGLPLGMYRGQP